MYGGKLYSAFVYAELSCRPYTTWGMEDTFWKWQGKVSEVENLLNEKVEARGDVEHKVLLL